MPTLDTLKEMLHAVVVFFQEVLAEVQKIFGITIEEPKAEETPAE